VKGIVVVRLIDGFDYGLIAAENLDFARRTARWGLLEDGSLVDRPAAAAE